MDINYKDLYKRALNVSYNAYCPYSHFHVGAALLTKSGKIFTGVNVENASYGATFCAERSAVASAITAGEKEFIAISVASPDGNASPCGICRQVLFEFGTDIKVITGRDIENLKIDEIGALLPKGFRL